MRRDRSQKLLALLLVCCTVVLALLSSPGLAAKPDGERAADQDEAPKWLRIERDDDGEPTALQTAIVRYQPKDGEAGPVVDLVGAIHVADRQYYENLNKEFKNYDVLLYELVAPEKAVPKRGQGGRSTHAVGAMQNGMKDMLELEHQLGWIDYQQKNFVHADMTPEQFSKSMSDRGESFLQMFFRMMGHSIAMQSKQQAQGKNTDIQLLAALFAKDRALRLKRVMADQFQDMEMMMVGFSGPDGSTLITERNKVALEVLQAQLDGGKKKLAIFYGAGHMKDMDERLQKDFGLEPVETRWITAWDLGDK